MHSCARCHGERYKPAPVPVVSAILGVIARRRRYRCADCGLPVWHHRLRRKTSLSQSLSHGRPSALASTVIFVAMVLVVLTGILSLRACAVRPPAPIVEGTTGAVRPHSGPSMIKANVS